MIQNKKRVTLNRRSSSLLLDYQAMLPKDKENGTLTNEYTRQLVESALSLPTAVKISTTPVNSTITKLTKAAINEQQKDKRIELPPTLKSSLRTPKSASAPCSPTTGLKSVQFSKHNLEDICLFRKAQTPLAISQKNIFWGTNDSEDDEEEDSSSSSSSESTSSSEEEEPIKTLDYANWPTRLSDIIDKKTKVIRIEKNTIRLMTDLIVGKVLVRNIDYHKTVTIRYTFDFWETIDNIKAKYQQDDHKNNNNNNTSYDVFSFKIKVPPNATTMYFAVHYKVGEQEYWDNNDGRNYEIQIKTTTSQKKKKLNKKKQADKEDGLKARYDFSQSINQAKNNDHLLLSKPTTTTTTTTKPSISPISNNHYIPPPPSATSSSPSSSSLPININSSIAMPIPIRRRASSTSSSPTGLSCHSPLNSSPSFMDLNSQSYMELVNKYCFYSTSPSSRSPVY